MSEPLLVPSSGKYKIGKTEIPDPSAVTVSINPLHGEATGRTDDGLMHTEIIHLGKRKIEITYNILSQEQLTTLCGLLMTQYYTFTYPCDPVEGNKTIECYGTTLSQELYSGVLYNGLWRNVKFSCIER